MPLSAFEATEEAWCCAKCLNLPQSPSPRQALKAAARLEAHNRAVARLEEERAVLANWKWITDRLNGVERASMIALASNDYLLPTQIRDVINGNTKLNTTLPRVEQGLAALSKKDLVVLDRFSDSEMGWRLTEDGAAVADQLPQRNWSIHADVPQSMLGAPKKYQRAPRVESVVGHYGARKGG